MTRYEPEYYQKNKERLSATRHEYYLKHKEEALENAKKWQHTKKGKKYRKKYFKEWYKKNRKHVNQLMNSYYYKNKQKTFSRNATTRCINGHGYLPIEGPKKECKHCGSKERLQMHHEVYPTTKQEIVKAIKEGKIYYLCRRLVTHG